MAARSKGDIVKEARAIALPFGVSVKGGEHAGETGSQTDSLTWQQAMIRLQLLQIELLSNIRESETAS